MILNIYIGTVLFALIPYALDRTITSIRLKKDKYKILSNKEDNRKEIAEFLVDMTLDFIPVINLFNGISHIRKLINNKLNYNIYKAQSLIDNKVIVNNKELSEEERFNEIDKTNIDLIDDFELTQEEKEKLKKAIDVIALLAYFKNNNYYVDDKVKDMSINDAYDYLSQLKEEYESKKELTRREKIELLKSEREEIINNINEKENKKILKKK